MNFALKCVKHPDNKAMFPLNPVSDMHDIRDRKKFKVNMALTERYKKSLILSMQRELNRYFSQKEKLETKKGCYNKKGIVIICNYNMSV